MTIEGNPIENVEYVACSRVVVNKVWSKALPKMASESPIRKSDLNGDGVEDIILGYGIDLDDFTENGVTSSGSKKMACFSSKSGETVTCEGGILALNGVTGDFIWQRWTAFNVFSIFCNVDLNGNAKNDCVASGRGGLIIAINGETGNLIWTLKESPEDLPENELIIDLYTVNPIRDLDGDGVVDIVAVHVEENEDSRTGHIRLISGINGKLIKSIPTPNGEEVFVPLQLLTGLDGLEQLLILTGGQNTPGGVYITSLESVLQGKDVKFLTVYRNKFSGFMSPAVLTDVTLDGVQDIILSSFNSTAYAFDGKTYQMLWNYTFPSSESVSSIVPGYFDRDNISDIMIKYNTGPGFPVYYYSQTAVLSGFNGSLLLDSPIIDSGGSNNLLGGISISHKRKAVGDYFLNWQVECRDKDKAMDAYQFIPESSVVEQSRADTCMLRYNTSTVVKLYALSRHIKPPGFLLFTSDDLNLNLTAKYNEYNNQKKAPKMVIKHPKMMKKVKSIEDGQNAREEKPINAEIKRVDQAEKDKFENIPKQHKIYYSKEPVRRKPKPYPYLTDPRSRVDYNGNDNPQPNTFNGYEIDQDYQEKLNELENEVGFLGDFPSLGSQYPTNRDVRSKDMENLLSIENFLPNDDLNETIGHSFESQVHDDSQTVKKVLKEELIKSQAAHLNGHAETLWDLEMEKEALEAMKDNGNVDYPYRQRRGSSSPRTIGSISSSGALLRSLKEGNSIDFVFALNVRESEAYPPLLLPEDLACLEEKVKTYQSELVECIIFLFVKIINILQYDWSLFDKNTF